jgi:hypothetical protein
MSTVSQGTPLHRRLRDEAIMFVAANGERDFESKPGELIAVARGWFRVMITIPKNKTVGLDKEHWPHFVTMVWALLLEVKKHG